jgi:hypothetical protein
MYASFLRISRALHLHIFQQPPVIQQYDRMASPGTAGTLANKKAVKGFLSDWREALESKKILHGLQHRPTMKIPSFNADAFG